MIIETKNWEIEYSHDDGRAGTVRARTEISKSEEYTYGNKKYGALRINGEPVIYDLRYNRAKDLHLVMLQEYFGNGLVRAIEVEEEE